MASRAANVRRAAGAAGNSDREGAGGFHSATDFEAMNFNFDAPISPRSQVFASVEYANLTADRAAEYLCCPVRQ